MIYLASPYSHPDPIEREARYLEAMRKLRFYVLEGIACFSPIVHSHEMAKIYNMGRAWETWATYNREMLRQCWELHILQLPGWDASEGIKIEREWARQFEIPELLVSPADPIRLIVNHVEVPHG